MESSLVLFSGRVLSLSGNSGFEIGDTRLLYRVLFTEKKSGEGLAFGCKTTVFESGIAEGGHQNSFQWKDEEFSFEIMASDQSLEEEGSVFFPVQGEIIITFYRSVEQGGNALIGSVSIDLQKFENKGLKKEEYLENCTYTTLLSGHLPLKGNESVSSNINLKISRNGRRNVRGIIDPDTGNHQCDEDDNRNDNRINHDVNSRKNYENENSRGDRNRNDKIKKNVVSKVDQVAGKELLPGNSDALIGKQQLQAMQHIELWNVYTEQTADYSSCESENTDLRKGLQHMNSLNKKDNILLERANGQNGNFVRRNNDVSTASARTTLDSPCVSKAAMGVSSSTMRCGSVVDTIDEYLNTYKLHHALSSRVSGTEHLSMKGDNELFISSEMKEMSNLTKSIHCMKRRRCRSCSFLKETFASDLEELQLSTTLLESMVTFVERENSIGELLSKTLLDVKSRYKQLLTNRRNINFIQNALICLQGHLHLDEALGSGEIAVEEG